MQYNNDSGGKDLLKASEAKNMGFYSLPVVRYGNIILPQHLYV